MSNIIYWEDVTSNKQGKRKRVSSFDIGKNETTEKSLSPIDTTDSSDYNLWPDNPLLRLTQDIRASITGGFYEPGIISPMERYIISELIDSKYSIEELLGDLYRYAIRNSNNILAFNTILVLSQLPYAELGRWASILAFAAIKSKFLDVEEMGVRCFENWGDKYACELLKRCDFAEPWLKEYANDVYANVMEAGEIVLFKENKPWQMASGREAGYSEESSSGLRPSGIEDGTESIISLEG